MDPSHDRGTGWAFSPLTAEAFVQAIQFALETWHHHPLSWRQLQRNGMQKDFTWARAAEEYEAVYERVLAWTAPPTRTPQAAEPRP